MKKSYDQFLENIIIPIEKNRVDNVNLYVSLEGKPISPSVNPDFTRGPKITQIDDSSLKKWGIEKEKYPGKWVTKEKNKFSGGWLSLRYPLHTLYTLLFCDRLQFSLFVAEYKNEVEPLRLGQLFSFMGAEDEILPTYLVNAFQCLPNGFNASEARIIRKINKWDYYYYWEFGLICVERALMLAKIHATAEGYKLPSAFFEGLDFAKAEYKDSRFQEREDYDTINSKYISNEKDSFLKNIFATRGALGNEMNSWVEKNYHLRYYFLKDAILNCMNLFSPKQIFSNVRAQIALLQMDTYRKEFDLPSFYKDGIDKSERIDYAFQKRELDWQIENLTKFIEE